MSHRERTVLMIGPRVRPGVFVGGTKISFENLLGYFERSNDWSVDVVDTSRKLSGRPARDLLGNILATLRVLARTSIKLPGSSVVMLNASPGGLPLLGAPLFLMSSIWRRPLVVRVFGGDLDRALARATPVGRWLVRRTIFGASGVWLQTRRLVAEFSSYGPVEWLPTSREPMRAPEVRSQCSRLLFVGQLRPQKGIREILAAIDLLPDDVLLTVCGTPMPGFDPEEFVSRPNVEYLGELPHAEVQLEMARHDALLFPTYWEGEGYPGVVIEALQNGLVVIASQWGDIPELITDEVNGLLIRPRCAADIVTAVGRLKDSPELVQRLSGNAARSGMMFSSDKVNAQVEARLHDLSVTREKG